jgi:hypothetical protein
MTSVWVSPRPFDREFLFVPVSNKWVAATATYSFGSFRPDQDSSEPLFRRQKQDDHQHREGPSNSHDFSIGFLKAFGSELLFVAVSNKWVAATTRYSFCQL